ncbi:MAG: PAS domain-containing sensor histidine kinase [Halothiobacillaceae bacterium]
MKRLIRARPSLYVASLGAMAVFSVLLLFSLLRLAQVEHDMRNNVSDNMLWVIAQTQVTAHRLDTAVSRASMGHADARVPLRHDLLLSRLNQLAEGPQRRYLDELGHLPALLAQRRIMVDLAPRLHGVMDGGPDEGLHDALDALLTLLGRMANDAMVHEWEAVGARLDRHREAVLQVIASILGMMLAGLLLWGQLLMALRRSRQASGQLQREKEFSELLIQSSGEGIMALDTRLDCTRWNAGMTALFGYSPPVASPVRDIAPFFAREDLLAVLELGLAGRSFELRDCPLDGDTPGDASPRYLDVVGFPLVSGGQVIGLILFLRDVTARFTAQQALAAQRNQLEKDVAARTHDLELARRQLVAAIETAPDGFAAFSPQGRLLLANARFGQLLPVGNACLRAGTALEQLLRAVLDCTEVEDAESTAQELAALMAGHSRELRLGDSRWLQLTVSHAEDGATVVRLADVTYYKRAARSLAAALAREQDVSEFYRSFAASVSHQFRTPLAVIDSGLQRLIRRADAFSLEELRERAGRLRQAVSGMTMLVERSLTAARLDGGLLAPDGCRCDLSALARRLFNEYRDSHPDRRFVLELPEDGPLTARGDPVLIEQILTNLLANAVKYAGDSAIRLRFWQDGEQMHGTVSDHGLGIPEAEQTRVFERFFRASNTAGVPGTGLGLHLSWRLARLLGGSLCVESRQGEGATFTLSLPRADDSE